MNWREWGHYGCTGGTARPFVLTCGPGFFFIWISNAHSEAQVHTPTRHGLYHELSWETRVPCGPYDIAVVLSASHSLCPATAFQLFLYFLDCQNSFTSICSTLARFLISPGVQASIRVFMKILQKFSLESSSTKNNYRQVSALDRYAALLCSSRKRELTWPGNHSGKSGDKWYPLVPALKLDVWPWANHCAFLCCTQERGGSTRQ